MKTLISILVFAVAGIASCSTPKKPAAGMSGTTAVSKNSQSPSNTAASDRRFEGDTFLYVQTKIVNQKARYINQPLSTLLHDLEIAPKSYMTAADFTNRYVTPGITISFYDANKSRELIVNQIAPVVFIVSFATPLPIDSTTALLKSGAGEWRDAEDAYYGKQVIKDITMSKTR